MKSKLVCGVCLLGLTAGTALASNNAVLMPGMESDVSSLIKQMKADGLQIPSDLRQMATELYGIELHNDLTPSPDRDGGNTAGTATPIVFAAGFYADLGSTVGKGNNITNATIVPANLCSNQSYSTSMAAEDAWYSFTLAASATIGATTVLPGTGFDTCLAIVAADGTTIKSINDDAPSDPAWRSTLSCCLPAGSYFLVVDGYSSSDVGSYELNVTNDGVPCIPDAFVCPANTRLYDEGIELGCGDFSHDLNCNDVFCGEIADGSDSDFYWILVEAPNTTITLNVYGNDTPGRAPYGWGLDPYIRVWDDMCTTVIAEDDDGGTGYDSMLLLECMAPGFYVVEVNTEWNAPGPYLLTLGCGVCCWENNTVSNPDILVTSATFMDHLGEGNAYVTTADLSDYCSILNRTGCFANGHCVQTLDGGEYWFNVYQPAIPAAGDCGYVMRMRTAPAYTPTCTPLVGVGRSGALLGYFALDASAGLFPSVYNEPAMPGQTTFVIDAPASCSSQVHVSIWYEWFDNGCPTVDADEQPSSFALAQNFPNPFNPTTSISFTLPEAGEASLKVFDLNGREVATLVNGMTERGEHTVSFDAGQFSTGVYFYTLQTNGMSATKKMVLVK